MVTVYFGLVPCAELVYLVKLALLGRDDLSPVVAEVSNQARVNGPLCNVPVLLGPIVNANNPTGVL